MHNEKYQTKDYNSAFRNSKYPGAKCQQCQTIK